MIVLTLDQVKNVTEMAIQQKAKGGSLDAILEFLYTSLGVEKTEQKAFRKGFFANNDIVLFILENISEGK